MYKIIEVRLNNDGTIDLLINHNDIIFQIVNMKIEKLDSWINCINAPNPMYPHDAEYDYKYAGKRHYAIDTSCDHWIITGEKI